MYNWLTLLYKWNKHNILTQLYSKKKKKEKKRKRKEMPSKETKRVSVFYNLHVTQYVAVSSIFFPCILNSMEYCISPNRS